MRKHFDSPQTCKICGKITPNKYALSSHKSLHNEKKHKCQYCGKVYFKIKLLKVKIYSDLIGKSIFNYHINNS